MSDTITVKQSTYSTMEAQNATETVEAPQTETVATETDNLGVVEVPDVVAPTTTEVVETTTLETVEQEENEASVEFNYDQFEQKPETQEQQAAQSQPTLSLKELAKKASEDEIKELLKEIGINEFALELNEHIKKGGKPVDYLNAKAINWDEVPDTDLVKDSLKKEYPNLTNEEVSRIYNKKYNQYDLADDDEREEGLLMLKAEAYKIRQQRKAEQANFKIADVQVAPQSNGIDEAQMQQAAEQQREQYKAVADFFQNHEATKAVNESKRVAIDLGDNGVFNFKLDKPEILVNALLDGNTWARITASNPGEPDVTKLQPDVKKLQRIVLAAINPNYEKDLVNYGKSLGKKTFIQEQQNAKRPLGQSTNLSTDKPSFSLGVGGKYN